MARFSYPVPLDGGRYPAILPRRCKGIIINNQSSVPIAVQDDSGNLYTTPAGLTQAFNSDLLVTPFYFATTTGGTGTASVTFSSLPVDTSNNPGIQQPPGVATTSDAATQAYLAALQGMVGTQVVAWSLVTSATQTTVQATLPLAVGIGAFGVFVNHPGQYCFLDIFYSLGLNLIYLDRKMPLIPESFATEPFFFPYEARVPAGGILAVQMTNSNATLTGGWAL